MKKIVCILLLFIVGSSFIACEYATVQPIEIEELDPDVEILLSTDIYSFLEKKKCGSCHSPLKGYHFGSTADTYTTFTTTQVIDMDNVENSMLLKALESEGYHSALGVSSTQIKELANKIELWINQGKKNN